MNTSSEVTVKSIVIDDYRAASIFERYGIDFCCHGNVSLHSACTEKGIQTELVQEELRLLQREQGSPRQAAGELALDEIIQIILSRHHAYVRRISSPLIAHTRKIASVHGKNHPELLGVADLTEKILSDMFSHMMKEERILFPYIASLAEAARGESSFIPAPFGTIANPIRMMEADHANAGEETATIRKATHDYQPPDDACTTYRVTLQELQAFEQDLHAHVHLENNILFPRSIELERQFLR